MISISLVGALAPGQQKPADPSLPSEQTVNAFLQQMFGYDASITWKVFSIAPSEIAGLSEVHAGLSNPQGSQNLKFYVTADGMHAINGEILPFGVHPFEPARKQLEGGAKGPSRGPANAPVTLVEFSDLQCPHCKEAQPNIDKLVSEDKNVRVVFQNFPLPMHDWAAKAAAFGDCVGRSSSDAFWKFVTSVYGAQSEITASNADEKLTAFANAAGVKGADVAACAAQPETDTRVQVSQKLGQSLGVDSTPTLFINGRKVPGVGYETLQKLVDFAAKPGT